MAVHLIFCRIIVEVVRPLPSPRIAPPPPPPFRPSRPRDERGRSASLFVKSPIFHHCLSPPPHTLPPSPLSFSVFSSTSTYLLRLHLRVVLTLRCPGLSPMVFCWIYIYTYIYVCIYTYTYTIGYVRNGRRCPVDVQWRKGSSTIH